MDPVGRTARVQPGVVLDQLNRALAGHGLQFGPEVATATRANLGGMLGNNSAGARSIVYGKTGDHVRRLRVVLSDGSTCEIGPIGPAEWERKAAGRGLEADIYRAVGQIVATNADEIRRRFASGNVTTGQIVMFGLSGGLIPCSAAIAVLVLCLQINQIWLGVALVLCFSIGLAITLIAAGMTAAIGMRHVSRRWPGFGEVAERVPYLSSIVMIGLGLYLVWQGWMSVPTAL